MQKTIIKAKSKAKYLSDIPELKKGLPYGIFNKVKPDVGGTHYALSLKSPYIIVVPNRTIIDSKLADKSLPYPIFGLQAKVLHTKFIDYIKSNEIHKFIVTYDSFAKLIKWCKSAGIEVENYPVLIDEYQMLLSELGYRTSAIISVLEMVKQFNHFTYMSATPISEDFLPNDFKLLPYTTIDWGEDIKFKPNRIKTSNPLKTAARLINKFISKEGVQLVNIYGKLERVKELFIFLNSVQDIASLTTSCNLEIDQVKIVCADTEKNKKTLKQYEINNIADPNKEINFFTSKAFQGADLFSESGLIVVVSDSKKKHTLVDIQTTLWQIRGRLRKKVINRFSNKLWHIYSTGYVTQTQEEFDSFVEEMKKESLLIMEAQKSITEEQLKAIVKRLDWDDTYCYFNNDSKKIEYSDIKEKYSQYNYNLTQLIYKDGFSIRDEYEKAKVTPGTQTYDKKVEESVIKLITTSSFYQLIQEYIELKENGGDVETLELEYPIFKVAYEKLGPTGIASAKYCEKTIKEHLYGVSDEVYIAVSKELEKRIGYETFISKKELKEVLNEEYKKLLSKVSYPASKIEELFEVKWCRKTINGKQIDGVELLKLKQNL